MRYCPNFISFKKTKKKILLASFTERYHTLTKYNPNTIDKLESVHWEDSPSPFKPLSQNDKIPLKSFLKLSSDSPESPSFLDALPAKIETFDLSTIAHLLYFTGGITSKMDTPNGEYYFRANPSAGALYPTEIYMVASGVKDLADGLYYYHPLISELHPIRQGNVASKLEKAMGLPQNNHGSKLQFLFTGIYARSAWRYKERAYRRILLDTGHVMGNLLELSHTLNLHPLLWAGFIDKQVEEFLKLETKVETPLATITLSCEKWEEYPAFQPASLPPKEAVKFVDKQDSVQIQQNTCEQIHSLPDIISLPTGQVEKESEDLLSDKGVPYLFKTILQRRSCREFSGGSIPLQSAREILKFAYRSSFITPSFFTGNFMKSFILTHRVQDCDSGLYELRGPELNWEELSKGDFSTETLHMTLGQPLSGESAFVLVHAVNLPALVEKYGDRGYRYICMDAGIIGQRINLISNSLGLGSSGIGGYFDDMVNETLGLPMNYAIIYITVVGEPASF